MQTNLKSDRETENSLKKSVTQKGEEEVLRKKVSDRENEKRS